MEKDRLRVIAFNTRTGLGHIRARRDWSYILFFIPRFLRWVHVTWCCTQSSQECKIHAPSWNKPKFFVENVLLLYEKNVDGVGFKFRNPRTVLMLNRAPVAHTWSKRAYCCFSGDKDKEREREIGARKGEREEGRWERVIRRNNKFSSCRDQGGKWNANLLHLIDLVLLL